jgi:glycine dehydrogenase subunit 1
MSYFFKTPADEQAMLAAIGIESADELFQCIPPGLRLARPLDLPAAMGELELTDHMSRLAAQNIPAGEAACFLGGGCYDHFIPAVVDALASRGDFYSSYTPYQPEVSQGNLQAMFEYQTAICQLTGMDVSNASLYDGGSALAEAALMCMSVTKRLEKVVVAASVHPEYRQVVQTYLTNLGTNITTLGAPSGRVAPGDLERCVDQQTACVLVQHPNFFGCLEEVSQIAEITHRAGARLVVVFDPISLGRLKRPRELGADVAVAEGQPLGCPLSFGGPYLGIMASTDQFMRRLPGRIAGQTVDRRDRRCWVLTLQTREQHIRREKATSNICTNQGLLALRATIYLAAMGSSGLREVADLCLQKAHYAAQQIAAQGRCELAFDQPFFKEFVLRDSQGQVPALLQSARQRGLLAGVPLGQWYPEWNDCFLVTVTEKRAKTEIDNLANCLAVAPSHQAALHA